MVESWKSFKLEEGIQTIVDYRGKTPRKSPSGIPLISAANIKNGKLDFTKAAFISEDDYVKWAKRGYTQPNDVLITTEAPVGEVALYPDDGKTYQISRRVIALRADEKVLHSKFLLHLLQYSNTIQALLANNRGSTVPRVLKTDITGLKLRLPEIEEQRAIASILSTLDDKIELNLQMNKTLEEMAMTLYRHWFVDFGPFQDGAFVDSELGRIPKGWEVLPMSQIAEVIMGTSPKGDTYNAKGEGLPLINGPAQFGKYFPTKLKWTTKPTKVSKINDLIFCVRGSTTGRRVISDGEYCLGRGVCSIRARGGYQNYINLLIDYNLPRLLRNTTGSVFPNLTGPMMKSFRNSHPTTDVVREFVNLVNPLSRCIWENHKENETLTNLRDTLLPKLISGEIRVKEAEKTISQAL